MSDGSPIDLGCGTGRNTKALAEAGFHKVVGVDFSKTALDIAKRRSGGNDVTFMEGDITKGLAFRNDSFGIATDIFAYFHILADADRRNYRRELHRVLRPNGLLLVSLATDGDGYYRDCPTNRVSAVDSSLPLRWDPQAKVGNILPSYSQLLMNSLMCSIYT